MRLVGEPLTLVNIAISMEKSSLAADVIFLEVSDIFVAVRPDKSPEAMLLGLEPLSFVRDSRNELNLIEFDGLVLF